MFMKGYLQKFCSFCISCIFHVSLLFIYAVKYDVFTLSFVSTFLNMLTKVFANVRTFIVKRFSLL